jgi:putative ABC transport system substrate-binding protein
MAELRWVHGRDYVIDARYGNGSGVAQAMEGLATEAVAARPDLFLVSADVWVSRLIQRTKTVPIVFAIAQDPVGTGVAMSLQRPGGNATGLTSLARDLGAKRLQLLKEAFPRIAHVAMLFEPANIAAAQVKDTEDAAARLGIRVTPIALRQVADIEAAFKRGTAVGAQAYTVAQGPVITNQRRAIADHLLRARAPAIFVGIEYVEAGGLMSYGPSFDDNFRRAAGYVDKILKGAKPGELPIEQPTKFEMVVNMKTAHALGIKIPNAILVRADKVIE